MSVSPDRHQEPWRQGHVPPRLRRLERRRSKSRAGDVGRLDLLSPGPPSLAASVQRRRSLADSPHGLGCSPSPPQVTDMRDHATSCQPRAAAQRASQEAACRNCRPRTVDRPPFGVSPGLRGEPFASPTQAVNGIFIKRLGHAATRTSAAAEHRNGGQRGRRQILGIGCEPESALVGSAWNAKSRTSVPAATSPDERPSMACNAIANRHTTQPRPMARNCT